jgi:dTDP-glucose 4,6-dehydratase
MITNALEDKPLPVYGDGLHVRDWIYVTDHATAVDAVLRRGRSGEVYNIGGTHDIPNIEIVKRILKILGKPETLLRHVADRPGHDRRYAMDSRRLRRELGWQPRWTFDQALEATVEWYLRHRSWWEHIRTGEYLKYYERMYGWR